MKLMTTHLLLATALGACLSAGIACAQSYSVRPEALLKPIVLLPQVGHGEHARAAQLRRADITADASRNCSPGDARSQVCTQVFDGLVATGCSASNGSEADC